MIDIIFRALCAYFLLNCVIVLLAMVQGVYLRHKNGLSFVPMPDTESESFVKEILKGYFNGIVLIFGAIPIAVYLFALIQADRLKEVKPRKVVKNE